jgi:hypothetical protein
MMNFVVALRARVVNWLVARELERMRPVWIPLEQANRQPEPLSYRIGSAISLALDLTVLVGLATALLGTALLPQSPALPIGWIYASYALIFATLIGLTAVGASWLGSRLPRE